ncbi:hypothetical protein MHU86_17594 [Fragilaria crotonensis]|nr:hypothetical protein MHU86_17594 [Fragilaria crotonensis]
MLRPYQIPVQTADKKATTRRRRLERPLILVTLVSMAILCNISFLQRRLALSSDQEKGPIMYTFYSEISDVPMPAGMAHMDHSRLLQFWVRSWTQAGWRAVVLNETHAQQHPDYAKLAPLVEKTGAGAYNQLCFLRWLALAYVGGGWMSDYDVFPLHDFRDDGRTLPNNGNLTLHNRLCPSLVSGSRDEWLRVGREMIEYASEHEINSDQKALAALAHEKPDAFMQDWSVTQTVFNASSWNDIDCGEHTPQSMRAVHFAHTPVKRALKEGRLPKGWSVRNRAEVASQFMEQWMSSCGNRKPFVRDARLLLRSRGIVVDEPVSLNKPIAHDIPQSPVSTTVNDMAVRGVVEQKIHTLIAPSSVGNSN